MSSHNLFLKYSIQGTNRIGHSFMNTIDYQEFQSINSIIEGKNSKNLLQKW